jgi:glutamate dehydrogenase/leucine dehydrogenase
MIPIHIECRIQEKDREIVGLLVIDSFIAHHSSGGVRMAEDVTAEELRLLARNMTLKFGLLGIPLGGAKAGILFDPDAPLEERRQALSAFGKAIAPFIRQRAYSPGPDIGVDIADVQVMLEAACRKKTKRPLPPGRSQYYTALTVFVSAERAARFKGIGMNGALVAVEGFGRIGSSLAKIYEKHGAKIVAISNHKGALFNQNGLNVDHLIREYEQKGHSFILDYREADKIANDQLLTLDVDILSPCARHHTITAANVKDIRAKMICAGANVPVDQRAKDFLFERSVLYVPDFVTNCGGVLGSFLEVSGVRFQNVCSLIPKLIGPKVDEIILFSKAQNIPTADYAAEKALEKHRRLKRSAERRGLSRMRLSPSFARAVRTLLPSSWSGKLGILYFQKSLSR